jgi:predicted methyltransferase
MENKPVYQLSLKDDAGLIKMYAFVNATNYQKVGTGNSLAAAWNAYTGGVVSTTTDEEEEVVETETISGAITAMESVVIDGETTFYFTLEGDAETIYIAKVSIDKQLPFIKAGDSVTIEVDGARVVSIVKQ